MRRAGWSVVLITGALLALLTTIVVRVATRVHATLRPPREAVGSPTGLAGAADVRLVTSDGLALRGWYLPSRNRAAVILGHGWGSQRASLLPEARALGRHGFGVLLFDWRAHGESDGTSTTWGAREPRDLDAALEYVTRRPDVDPRRIGALGFSMGGMIISEAAKRDPRLRAVVLEGAFTSLYDQVHFDEGRWGWLSTEVSILTLRFAGIEVPRMGPGDGLCAISPRPLLVIYGGADKNMSASLARRDYDAACAPKSLWIIPGAKHLTYAERAGPELESRLAAFFEGALIACSALTSSEWDLHQRSGVQRCAAAPAAPRISPDAATHPAGGA